MGFLLRNIDVSVVALDDLGEEIAVGQDYDLAQLPPNDVHRSANGGDLETQINAGTLVILDPDDDVTPLNAADSLDAAQAANLSHYRDPTGGSPGGGVTVEDEGTPLATVADTLNFTGAGVTASGAGTTKTINIPGGGAGDPSFFTMDFSTTTTNADPGDGVFRYNSGTFASITELYIDNEDQDGFPIEEVMGGLTSGDMVFVQQKDDATKSQMFKLQSLKDPNPPLTSAPQTGYWLLRVAAAVNFNGSGGLPDNNAECLVSFIKGSGQQVRQNIDDAEDTTTSTTFQFKTTLTLRARFDSDWTLFFYAEVRSDDAGTLVDLRIIHAGSSTVIAEADWQPDAGNGAGYGAWTGFIVGTKASGILQLVDGVENIFDMEFRSSESGKQVRIRNAMLSAMPTTTYQNSG